MDSYNKMKQTDRCTGFKMLTRDGTEMWVLLIARYLCHPPHILFLHTQNYRFSYFLSRWITVRLYYLTTYLVLILHQCKLKIYLDLEWACHAYLVMSHKNVHELFPGNSYSNKWNRDNVNSRKCYPWLIDLFPPPFKLITRVLILGKVRYASIAFLLYTQTQSTI